MIEGQLQDRSLVLVIRIRRVVNMNSVAGMGRGVIILAHVKVCLVVKQNVGLQV